MERSLFNLKKLELLEKNLNYKFNNIMLLKQSLIHSSYANENKMKITESNQRLEFLGDSILNLIVSQDLYKDFPDYLEGELTKIRAAIVCESSLAYLARKINLGEFILLGNGEKISGGRERNSILSDTFEALIGAIYMDSSYKQCKKVILDKFNDDMKSAMSNGELFVDYKTNLQEKFQIDKNNKIEYKVIKELGPDHNKNFYINVLVNNKILGSGKGSSKKFAEQMAAKKALLARSDQNE